MISNRALLWCYESISHFNPLACTFASLYQQTPQVKYVTLTRQKLLDALRQKDGQTLTDLQSSLDITRKSGRFKYHHLNAAPLQGVMAAGSRRCCNCKPRPKTLRDLKTKLEQDTVGSHTMEFPTELGILTCLMILAASL